MQPPPGYLRLLGPHAGLSVHEQRLSLRAATASIWQYHRHAPLCANTIPRRTLNLLSMASAGLVTSPLRSSPSGQSHGTYGATHTCFWNQIVVAGCIIEAADSQNFCERREAEFVPTIEHELDSLPTSCDSDGKTEDSLERRRRILLYLITMILESCFTVVSMTSLRRIPAIFTSTSYPRINDVVMGSSSFKIFSRLWKLEDPKASSLA